MKQVKIQRVRYKSNVEGDFYTEDGICTACDAAPSEAPELIAYDDKLNCYFKRQPKNIGEIQKAISAVCASCVEGLRYSGADVEILDKLPVQCCDYYDNEDQNLAQVVISQYARGKRDFRWTAINHVYLDFRGTVLNDADFSHTFIAADFRGADLKNCRFNNARLMKSDFSDANLENTSFKEAFLDDTKFNGANMKDAIFEGAKIHSYVLKLNEKPNWLNRFISNKTWS